MTLINIQKVKDPNKVKGLTGKLAAGISCCRLWGQAARWPPFVSHTLAWTFHFITLCCGGLLMPSLKHFKRSKQINWCAEIPFFKSLF